LADLAGLTFLNHQYVDGKWVEREHDAEGRYISSFNLYLGLLRVFFRWLFNRDKPDEDWETPAFLRIKTKKPLRDSPYGISDIWELNDVLTIVQYEPELPSRGCLDIPIILCSTMSHIMHIVFICIYIFVYLYVYMSKQLS
jgi:hypothetical protein